LLFMEKNRGTQNSWDWWCGECVAGVFVVFTLLCEPFVIFFCGASDPHCWWTLSEAPSSRHGLGSGYLVSICFFLHTAGGHCMEYAPPPEGVCRFAPHKRLERYRLREMGRNCCIRELMGVRVCSIRADLPWEYSGRGMKKKISCWILFSLSLLETNHSLKAVLRPRDIDSAGSKAHGGLVKADRQRFPYLLFHETVYFWKEKNNIRRNPRKWSCAQKQGDRWSLQASRCIPPHQGGVTNGPAQTQRRVIAHR
jgi:hypothetical protein